MLIIYQILSWVLSPFTVLHNACLYRMQVRNQRFASHAAIGTHQGHLTRTLMSDNGLRGHLVTMGQHSTQVVLSQANTFPMGTLMSSCSKGNPVGVALNGCAESTFLLIASTPIEEGSLVYTAANGMVQSLPKEKGTYYRVGLALTSTKIAGGLIEVDPHTPLSIQVA